MKTLLIAVLAVGLLAPVQAATCNPNGICRACSNCSQCKNCAKNGGSCSVCRRREAEIKRERSGIRKLKPA